MDENEQILRKHFETEAKKIDAKDFFPMVSGDLVVLRNDVKSLKNQMQDIKNNVVPTMQSKDTWTGISIGIAATCLLVLLGTAITLATRAIDKKSLQKRKNKQ